MLREFRGFSEQTTEQPPGWHRQSSSGSVVFYPGRVPGTFSAVAHTSATYGFEYRPTNPLPDTVVFGYALFMLNTTSEDLIEVYGVGDAVALEVVAAASSWRIMLGSTVLATFPAPSANTWHYVEFKARLDTGATGRATVRVDGQTVADFTGVTRSGSAGHSPVERLIIGSGGSSSAHLRVTDIYIADTTGTTHNDFLGDVVVLPITPTGPGAHSDWTGSDGNTVDNHLLVDELPPSTTDYVATAAVGARETYTCTDIPADEQVHAVKVTAALTRSDAGYAGVKHLIRNPTGQVAVGAEKTFGLGGTEIVASGPFTVDPAGQPWTPGTVNAAEYGVEAT